MYEVVSIETPDCGIFCSDLLHARCVAEPGDEIWQVADDSERTRVCLIPFEPEPGTRVVGGRVLYSADWL